MKVIKYIAVLAAFGVMPMSLQAMSLSFDLTGSSMISSSFWVSDGGVSITATAQRADTNGDIFVSRDMTYGMGACADVPACGASMMPDSPELDAFDPAEILSFAVSSAIYLNGALFSDIDLTNPGDSFYLFIDGSQYGGLYNPLVNPFDFDSILVNSSFAIHAYAGGDIVSSFRLTEIYATALPEPGTLGMLVFGLAVVGWIRRRQSR